MLPFANPTLLNGHALPVDNDEPHVQPGSYLRVSHHPLLGLPVAPFVISRAMMESPKQLNKRNEAVFTDRTGVLTPPFVVTPGNPVTARVVLGPLETCIWAQIVAKENHSAGWGGSGRDPDLHPTRELSQDNKRRGSVVSEKKRLDPRLRTIDPFPKPVLIPEPFPIPTPAPTSGLVCEAFINSALGPASIGRRSSPRYAFSGPGIVEVTITGSGQVFGMEWVEAHDKQPLRFIPYTILNLPHEGGARYVSIENAFRMAVERVEDQAPKRRPLQETIDTPPPEAAPLADINFEKDRVESLGIETPDDLEELINNLAEMPLEQVLNETFFDESGNEVGTSTTARLSRVNQMQLDPGTAAFLGYKLRDRDFTETENRLIFYQINGYFRDFPSNKPLIERSDAEILFDAMLAVVPPENRNWTRGELIERYANDISQIKEAVLHPDATERLEDHAEYFGIGTIAVADRGAPLDKIRPPVITPDSATSPNPRHIGWVPATPPEAIREVRVDVEKTRVAGLLAAGKKTPSVGPITKYKPLNKENSAGFHLPLVLSINNEGEGEDLTYEPGKGFVADRRAGPMDIRYAIAQQDRFGRWSNWATRVAAAGPRPKPPRPEFQAFYTQPSIADAPTTGGAFFVKVTVPDAEALAPGSHLLDHVELTFKDANGTMHVVHEDEAAKSAFAEDPTVFYLKIDHSGPILNRSEQREMHITGRWVDVAGVKSDKSEKQIVNMVDPRPPTQLSAPISLPDALQYAARPDVTGLSWVEHRWTAQPDQSSFAIFYTDENRLKAHLAEADTGVLDAINAAPDAAARATIYRANSGLFPDHLFEKLQGVDVSFASGERGFRHAVSGSLRLLNFYKIAAISESGAKPALLDLPMIIYGIPNSDPPAKPSLQVAPVEPKTGENDFVAEVTIELSVGATLGETWRLRRSSVESSNINKMPVVATGEMGAMDELTGLQTATYRDDGPVEIATSAMLKPWVRYSWIAEVQGVPEAGSVAAGSPVAGRWSSASDPVSLILIPAEPPAPFTITDLSGMPVAGGLVDVIITVKHAENLGGGSIGAFRYRLSRRAGEGEPLKLVREATIEGAGSFQISGMTGDASDVVAIGSQYVLELIDPLGRNSAPATITAT